VIDIPRPLRYFSNCPKIAFKIPIPRERSKGEGRERSKGEGREGSKGEGREGKEGEGREREERER